MWLCYRSLVSCSQAQAEDQQRYLKIYFPHVKNTECYKLKYFFTRNKQYFGHMFIETVLLFGLISGEIIRCTTSNNEYDIKRETAGEVVGDP